jgi:long-chain acyl-CoA synthetase
VPNPDALRAEVIRQGLVVPPNATALTHPEIVAIYRERIDRQLANVAPYEQVRKFTLLSRGFSIEAGELTPKLSLRRQQIQANFAGEIAAMYGP